MKKRQRRVHNGKRIRIVNSDNRKKSKTPQFGKSTKQIEKKKKPIVSIVSMVLYCLKSLSKAVIEPIEIRKKALNLLKIILSIFQMIFK